MQLPCAITNLSFAKQRSSTGFSRLNLDTGCEVLLKSHNFTVLSALPLTIVLSLSTITFLMLSLWHEVI